MSKEQALKSIDEFAASDKHPAFVRADRKTVADQMRARVDNPFLIDQGQAGICGPATVAFDLLRRDPADYVWAVKMLFEWGGATIRKWQIRPCRDLLVGAMPNDVPQADWILLASIRDSENWFYDYTTNFKLDDGRAGTPLDEIAGWLRKAGYKSVECDGIYLFGNREANLKKSLQLYNDEYQVTWFICADLLDSKIPDSIKPDHFVVLAGDFVPPASKSTPVHIPVFTWGSKMTVPRTGGLTYQQFLDQYFGYVAGKF